jgi:hypothetical protein
MAGRRVRPGGQFSPESVIDVEEGLDDEMRKVMDDMNWPAPDDPGNFQIGTVPVARPGGFHQGYLHHGKSSAIPLQGADRGFLAGNDDGSVAGCRREAVSVAGVAGQDAVARGGEEHDGRVYRIGCTCGTQQGTGLTAVPLADCAHGHSPQEPREVHLPTVLVRHT